MAIWLVRAGGSGEYESKFLDEGKVYLTWDNLKVDLSALSDRQKMLDELLQIYPDVKKRAVMNWRSQIHAFAHRIKKGDWVVLPSKFKSAIHIGKVTGDYVHDSKADNPFYHCKTVDWFGMDIPRSNFDQDILYSFGAFMTVCQIRRNNAEERIKRMSQNNWQVKTSDVVASDTTNQDVDDTNIDFKSDIEETANDQIAKLIIRKFSGHKMEVLIDSILKAKGYTTYRSGKGADKGIDILAAPQPMGFGQPRLCVQVKTTNAPIDRPTLDQLIGAIHNFGAEQGLLVSWYGFKNSVEKERANHFFKVRLWAEKEIISEFLTNYDRLDDEIKAEIPLKRIWALSVTDDE